MQKEEARAIFHFIILTSRFGYAALAQFAAVTDAKQWPGFPSARAKIKVLVKRILRKHGYPPELQDEAVKTVLAQAELPCAEWTETTLS